MLSWKFRRKFEILTKPICEVAKIRLYIWYIVFSPDEDEDELDEDEETRILLEKEFDDFYEDQVLKNQTHFPRRLCASKLKSLDFTEIQSYVN